MSKKGKEKASLSNGHSEGPSEGEALFAAGAIVKIGFENFVTYTSVEFVPDPRLNVIVGPNGSGKSSIVCGICLGLAGKPNLLGRASSAAEYIKHGCNKATIKLELNNPNGQNYIIEREILQKTSNWKINNQPKSQKDVELVVTGLGIQVGNLCQFLPQDKVSDFAKMTPQELLDNTELAVSPELYKDHQRLKTAGEKQREYEVVQARTVAKLERETGLNVGLEQDVKNFRKRLEHIEQLDLHKKKKAWLEYHISRDDYNKVKELKKELQRELNVLKDLYAPLRLRHRDAERQVKDVDTLITKNVDNAKVHEENVNKSRRKIDGMVEKIQQIDDDLAQVKQDEENRKRKLRDICEQMNALKGNLSAMEGQDNTQVEMDRVNEEMRVLNGQMNEVQKSRQAIQRAAEVSKRDIRALEGELKVLRDKGNQSLEILRGKHEHTYKAVLWLRSNQHLFSAPIQEPMMLSINVDPRYAKYVESRISFNDMKAFMCSTKADMDIFLNNTREALGYRVNAILTTNEPSSDFQPNRPIEDYRQYGFHSYLRELFTCPEPILRYLCVMYKVHKIPVGNHTTKNMIERVQRECEEFTQLYTEDNEYSVKTSNYSGQKSSRCTTIRAASLLTASVDNSREQEVSRRLKAEQDGIRLKDTEDRNLKSSLDKLEEEMNKMRNQSRLLAESKTKKTHLLQMISIKEASIKSSEESKKDIDVEEKRASAKKQDILLQKHRHIEEMREIIEKYIAVGKERVSLSLRRLTAQKVIQAIEAEIGDRASSLQDLETRLTQATNQTEAMKQAALSKYKEACRSTNTRPNEALSEEYELKFQLLPNSVDQVEMALHELQARIDCTMAVDNAVIEDYEARKIRIAELERELSTCTNQLTKHKEEIDVIRQNWLTPVQALIAKISDEFSRFFDMMNCAGEVELNVPENHEDYDKYGVRIMVKFRDTEALRELTAHHQSGGERSVTTVLYMMALQELTHCPFRCVDEINQGMDPINERLVFEIVVETVTRSNASQYFLLTPKLLPGLHYNDNLMVLCVHNGPHVLSHTEWDINKFLKRRKKFD